MVNTVQVNANHGRDFHVLTNHMTKLKNFIVIFPFSLQLIK